MSDIVSDDVRAFLREYIESYEELELVLLLHRESLGSWSAQSLGAQLHLDSSVLDGALLALLNKQLVKKVVDERSACYQLQSFPALDGILGRLARTYASNAVEIVKLMSAHSIERIRTAALRTFANAFVFRKDKRNG